MTFWLFRSHKRHIHGPFSSQALADYLQQTNVVPEDEIAEAGKEWMRLSDPEARKILEQWGVSSLGSRTSSSQEEVTTWVAERPMKEFRSFWKSRWGKKKNQK